MRELVPVSELHLPRPRTRDDCRGGDARPCPWVGCRHHLALVLANVSGRRRAGYIALEGANAGHLGRRRLLANAPAHEVARFVDDALEALPRMSATCALDVAERGEHTVEEVADYLSLGVTEVKDIQTRLVARLRDEFGDEWLQHIREVLHG